MSALLRSRPTATPRDDDDSDSGSGGSGGAGSQPTVILDGEQQESLVRALEGEATRSAWWWRGVFGIGAVLVGCYFAHLAARACSRDTATVWSGVIHVEFYKVLAPLHVAALDAATAFAALAAGAAMLLPKGALRWPPQLSSAAAAAAAAAASASASASNVVNNSAKVVRAALFAAAVLAGAGAALGWVQGLRRVGVAAA
eukprot:CAMPEP_0197585182 /NCGR_PEP_ID=MMETSP1326-20131121/7559_1 /TAXON_ID=1155430 /ORGANISM="Genus nov. species nov., Strain RCC2288" /LENGTH=199 /DNA_ID=CAMNT_0043149647 /DNA_START=37 /DNA_END=632 /DNA_ORIENTATION=-